MKKYLMAITAVVLAITFSAYTGKNKVPKKKLFLATFSKWYNVQTSGTQIGTLFYSGTPVDMQHVVTDCRNQISPACLIGSNATLTQGSSLPSKIGNGDPNVPNDADNYILETQ